MRKLASIQRISALVPIPNKDRIVQANVLGWSVIVRKDEYHPGELCVFVEPDAVLPEKPEFEFLRDKKFRIKTMKMGGVLSQGICFPLSILPPYEDYQEGDDVTEALGIKQYEPTMDTEPHEEMSDSKCAYPKFLMRYKWFRRIVLPKKKKGGFPDFIAKTDEIRIQNLPFLLSRKDITFVGREKIDGQSGTFFLRKEKGKFPWSKPKYEFGVCSRNLRLSTPDNSSYWQVAKKYEIEKVLRSLIGNSEWVAIQGECIAPNVQGNKYRVKEPDLYCFNLICQSGKVDCQIAESMLKPFGLKWAPLVYANYTIPDTVEEVLADATGQSALYNTLREGVVFRNYEHNISFKAVSPDFLIKHDE